ncbi:MAG: deoxyribonuclease IV [Brooklawnia sp.]|uniref:deoxyribonuclease IV n=1 Tax=Brooklawnia sp. TaxID=2699740 RepID=UPI003C76A1BF
MTSQPLELGAHVDQSDPVAAAQARDAQIVQHFIGDPQAWKGQKLDYPSGPAALKEAAEQAGIGLYVHAPYVINVASTNNRIRIPSRKLLQQQVTAAAEIGARGLIVHGGHVGAGEDPLVGYENWYKAIGGLRLDCPILIENTAGGANAMARTVESIELLWQAVSAASGAEQVGFCLDTCHAHASGEELDGLVGRIRAITGRIDLVHANDSRDPQGSGADRHARLGRGQADPEFIMQVITEAGAPVIIETHGSLDDQIADLNWIRARL